MKKISILAILIAGILRLASAQTITISGTVKTSDGDALYLAFVQDKQFKAGAYTDSLGTFTLTVHPTSQLYVKCFGFRDTLIQIDRRASFSIVLTPKVNITASRIRNSDKSNTDDVNKASLRDQIMYDDSQQSFQILQLGHSLPMPPVDAKLAKSLSATEAKGGPLPAGFGSMRGPSAAVTIGPDMAQGAIFPVFSHKEESQGSRFFFSQWVHGYVINAADSLIQSPGIYFNYDKIGGNLLLSRDRHAAIEINKETVKSFTLFDPLNQSFTFTMVPEIDKTHFVQVISEGANYSIYKSIKTKFVTADYVSDGVVATGDNFDSFQDVGTYYLLNVKTHQLQQIALKKKAIKQVFANQADKVNKFMTDNYDEIDDGYLARLGEYMDK